MHDNVDEACEYGDADDARDPVDTGVGSPAKDEQAGSGSNDRDQSRSQPPFLCAETVLLHVGDQVEVQIGEVDDHGDDTGNDDAHKDQPGLSQIEAVHGAINEWKYFKEGVIDTVDQSSVDVREQHRWIKEHDFKGLDDSVNRNVLGRKALAIDFRLRPNVLVAARSSKSGRSPQQDVRSRGFGEEEEPEDEDGAGKPEDLPERPAPVLRRHGESREHGAERRCGKRGRNPEGDGVGQV